MKVRMMLVALALVVAGCSQDEAAAPALERVPLTTHAPTASAAPTTTMAAPVITKAPISTVPPTTRVLPVPTALSDSPASAEYREALELEAAQICRNAPEELTAILHEDCETFIEQPNVAKKIDRSVASALGFCMELDKEPDRESRLGLLESRIQREARKRINQWWASVSGAAFTDESVAEIDMEFFRDEFEEVGDIVYFLCPSHARLLSSVNPG
jgi:hypothetical protein